MCELLKKLCEIVRGILIGELCNTFLQKMDKNNKILRTNTISNLTYHQCNLWYSKNRIISL